MAVIPPSKPKFRPLLTHEMGGEKFQFWKVFMPMHWYTPTKEHQMEIYTPIFKQMNIDIRMNLKAWKIELKTWKDTPDVGAFQKCANFVHAFILGFDIHDVVAFLQLDDLYVESFEIKDVKNSRLNTCLVPLAVCQAKQVRQNL